MKNSHIEWTDHTFNPWIGCTKVSPGCEHCYAEARDQRFAQGKHWGKGAPRERTSEANWKQPLSWNRRAEKTRVYGDRLFYGFGRERWAQEPGYRISAESVDEHKTITAFSVEEWESLPKPRPRVFCASLADWLDDEVDVAPAISKEELNAIYQNGFNECKARTIDCHTEFLKTAEAIAGLSNAFVARLKELSDKSPENPVMTVHHMEARPIAPRAPLATATRPANPDGTGPGKAERKVLTALAQYHAGRTKSQLAILTGYAVNGGGFNNALSRCRSQGWVQSSGDSSFITPNGFSVLGDYTPLPTGKELARHWLGQLGKAERAVLEVLLNHLGRPLSKETVAQHAGYEPSGGGFNNALSRLRTLELIEGRGELSANPELF